MHAFRNAPQAIMIGVSSLSGMTMAASDNTVHKEDPAMAPDFIAAWGRQKIIKPFSKEDYKVLQQVWRDHPKKLTNVISKLCLDTINNTSREITNPTKLFLQATRDSADMIKNVKNLIKYKALPSRKKFMKSFSHQDDIPVFDYFEQEKIHSVYDFHGQTGTVGAFGTVFSVTHKVKRTKHAVKQISFQGYYATESKLFKLLRNEIRIMVKLNQVPHDNIIKLEEVYEERNTLYIVMELCEGGELFDQIDDLEGYKEKDAAIIMKQMLSAVQKLHTMGIGHYDLKTENFLFADKDRTKIKLIDFGLSSECTTCCEEHGTPFYMAPDILMGNKTERQYNKAVDMWAIGAIAYIMVYNTPAFWGDNDAQIFERVKYGFIPELRQHYGPWFPKAGGAHGEVSEECRDFIAKCLRFDHDVYKATGSAIKACAGRINVDDAIVHEWITNNDDYVIELDGKSNPELSIYTIAEVDEKSVSKSGQSGKNKVRRRLNKMCGFEA